MLWQFTQILCIVYNFVLYVYFFFLSMKYFIYVLQAKWLYIIELASNSFKINKWIWCYINKTEANLASTNVLAARCVRVIHAQCVLQFALLSRTLLRSSSNNEPSDPPYRIIFFCIYFFRFIFNDKQQWFVEWKGFKQDKTLKRDVLTCYLHNGATQSHITHVWWNEIVRC
jgi:hypothetical protein